MLELIILISGIVNLILGLIVVFGAKDAKGMRYFVSFAFATFLWALFNFFIHYLNLPIFVRLSYSMGPIIITFLLLWVFDFSSEKGIDKKLYFIFSSVGLLFALLPFVNGMVIAEIYPGANSIVTEETGPLYPIFVSYVFVGYAVVLLRLIRHFLSANIEEKKHIKIVLTGFSIYGALTVLFGLILPLMGVDKFIDFDVPCSLIFVLFTSYAIVNYKWMDVKTAAVEIFSILIIAATFIQFLIADSSIEKIINFLIFSIVTTLSIYLIRGVINEIKRKEELQILSEKLANANRELKQLDQAKTEFISIASHQLRTPLTAIKGYISLILEGSYGEISGQVQDVLNKLYVVNNRMTQLVEDLLNVSRIESGRVQFNFQPTQLEIMVSEVVDVFLLMAKSKNLSLQIHLPKKPLPKIIMDGNKIKEVVSNLIDNALKYTKEGGVTVTVRERNGFAEVLVTDTGIGIPKEDINHVFEKFRRSSESMKLDVSGTGLGLYVGRSFLKKHGGSLTAESAGVGKGTTFIISLPIVSSLKVEKQETSLKK